MTIAMILLQGQQILADSLANMTKKFSALPDSLSTLTPQKLQQNLQDFNWNEVITSLTDTAVNLCLRILAALVVFIIGRFIITRTHNLLRSLMVARDMDRSLTTFLLSLFRITFFFVLVIIVISILGIETSSFIAIFASAGIAIGMAFSGTLQNFAGGVLILVLKPYRVGDFIEFDKYMGTVKEIQIFNTIITTYNNESIIIPNGGLSTGIINNYSREKVRRLEWRIDISYGDDVDVARKVILDILNADERLLKHGTEDDPSNSNEEKESSNIALDKETSKKRSWLQRLLRRHHAIKEKADAWRDEKLREINAKMSKIDFTPTVSVESLGDNSVTLVVRAWSSFANYWPVFYSVNETIYKQLPKHGVRFPFPQMDVHINNK